MVLDRTSFRIRVLTKNAVVGSKPWVDFFAKHGDRFVVGLSTGTLDNSWARMVELKTSLPTARIRALNNLQDAGVPTFGMLCPVFPHAVENDGLERLVDAIRPGLVEHVWAEPYNDRFNWQGVYEACPAGGPDRQLLSEVYGEKNDVAWSHYATGLYTRCAVRPNTKVGRISSVTCCTRTRSSLTTLITSTVWRESCFNRSPTRTA